MADLVWSLPDGEGTARWVEDAGGGGGSQDLASVLSEGGDPEGNPITGRLVVDIANPDLDLIGVSGGLDGTASFIVYNDGGIEVATTGEDFNAALSIARSGAPIFVVGATGTVTVNTGGIVFPAADPHVAGAWWDNAGTLTRSAG